MKVKQRRLDKARQKQQPVSEQPKTNKEKRLEKNQKLREKRQRKREANKEMNLEEGKESKEEKSDTGSKEDTAPNSDVKFQRKNSENSVKIHGKRKKEGDHFQRNYQLREILVKLIVKNKEKFHPFLQT